jgi:NAD(P)-dependent dehydrogenase (short-subunit alcohol dehydrogenase family)
MKLKNKVAVVTGSSRGIGKAIALRFAAEGAKLVINCRSTVDKAKAVVKEIEKQGGEAVAAKADAGNRKDADKLIAQTIKHFGRLDVLVANAGIIIDKPFAENTDADWERAMHSILDATFYTARAAVPHMTKRGSGRIIATGSIIAERYEFGGNKMAVCTAAKAGMMAMLRALAAEVAERGVTVNAVSPGYIATEMFATIDPKGLAAAKKLIPMRRFGTPEDIASAMLFLASDDAGYITGQTIRVNGGMAML